MDNLRNKCAIAGIGETRFGKLQGVTDLSLSLEACKRAIDDAGLKKEDIDGVVSQPPYGNPYFIWSLQIASSLGISPKVVNDLNVGGATPVSMVQYAAMAVDAGLCDTVLCVYGEASNSRIPRHGRRTSGAEDFDFPFGYIGAPVGYAMAARRHMHEYGTTNDQLGAIAVACRKHALLNGNAQMTKPITLEDYRNSRWMFEPFRLLDCCLVSDGGVAVVVTSAERARELRKPPAYIVGMGQFHPSRHIEHASSMTTVGSKQSSQQAYQMAGLGPKDVDVAELYDCFTYTLLVQLEDCGFCSKGEGGPFVESGSIELGGELPVNTHGGLLSQAHMDGMNHITEAVKQLRGEAGAAQVKDTEIALVTGNGAVLATHASLILAKQPV